MSTFGLDGGVGFIQKMVEDIIDDLEDAEKSAFGESINTTAASVFGQLNGVFGGAAAENWEVLNEVYQSFNPNTATGAALDRLANLTGVVREPATKSSLLAANSPANQVTLTGDPATILLAGRLVSVATSGALFVSQDDVALVAATAWVGSTAYVLDDRVTNSGNIYICIGAGTSGPSIGPGTELESEADGTAFWRFVGNGTAFVDADFAAQEFGPIAAPSANMVIESPVTGWDSAKNLLDADIGVDLESDADLRIRRANLLRAQGSATVEAILADILEVTDVTAAIVFENDTILTDGEGRPPKSVEVVAQGGTDLDVATALFNSKAAGIATFGYSPVDVTVPVTDSQGIVHSINFSRPVSTDIYIDIAIDVDADTYEGDTAVKEALAAFGDTLSLGDDVIVERIKCAAFEVSGVVDITGFIIDTTAIPPGTNTANIVVPLREVALFDTSRIDVVATPV